MKKRLFAIMLTAIFAVATASFSVACTDSGDQETLLPPSEEKVTDDPATGTAGEEPINDNTDGTQESDKGQQDGEQPQGGSQEQQGGNGEEQGEQGENGGEVQNPEETITEAQYKQMFLENLPKAIEDYYNENVAKIKSQKLSSVELVDINLKTNKMWFTATQQGIDGLMFSATSSVFSNSTFKEMNDALENFSGEFSKAQKIVDQDLADEIAAFALEQQPVIDYLAENVGEYSSYSVISASEFESSTNGRTSNIKINFGDRIVDLSIYCTTGAKSTQEEYLDAFKNSGRQVTVEFNWIEDYQSLDTLLDAEE